MDHHVLPHDPIDNEVKVPFVARKTYDGGRFLTYPIREGFPWPLSEDSPLELIEANLRFSLPSMTTSDQESFFQTWLFFGLLQLYFGEFFDIEEYKKVEDGMTYVTTEVLMTRMKQAWEKRVVQSSADKVSQYERLARCLKLVLVILPACNPDFDWRIKLSIACLYELWSLPAFKAFETQGVKKNLIIGTRFGSQLFEEERNARMRAANWCPNDIVAVAQRFTSAHTLYFLSRMKKLELRRSHKDCTSYICTWNQLKKEEYQTMHVVEDCPCDHITVTMDSLKACLFDDKLALLRVNSTGERRDDVSLDVVKYTGVEDFVAISHVWANGLGNPCQNSLPSCQVNYLHGLVSAIGENKVPGDGDSYPSSTSVSEQGHRGFRYLWIDSLCCPATESAAKDVSIRLLKETYQRAKYVLVLDAGLTACDAKDLSPAEVAARIFTSTWLQRLWTLQEGVMAEDRLWFQFKDQPVKLITLMETLTSLQYSKIAYMPLVNDMILFYYDLSMTFTREESPVHKASEDKRLGYMLRTLDRCLRYRSVTVPSDEALCIFNLLRLPAHRILSCQATTEARMSKIWQLVAEEYKGIPQRIIGLNYPRLQTKGMRWAPRTLLHGEPGLFDDDTASLRDLFWLDPILGQVTELGLAVKLPGWSLSLRQWNDLPVRNPWQGFEPWSKNGITFRDSNGARYDVAAKDSTRSPAGQSRPRDSPFLRRQVESGCCHIIIHTYDVKAQSTDVVGIGVIGRVTSVQRDDSSETLHFEMVEHVQVISGARLPHYSMLNDTAQEIAYSLRKDPLSVKLATMLDNGETEGYDDTVEQMREKIRATCSTALEKNPELLSIMEGEDWGEPLNALAAVVRDWFYHDYVATELGPEQNWCVD